MFTKDLGILEVENWIDSKLTDRHSIYYYVDWSPVPCSPFQVDTSKGRTYLNNSYSNMFNEDAKKVNQDPGVYLHIEDCFAGIDEVICSVQYIINSTGIFLFRIICQNENDESSEEEVPSSKLYFDAAKVSHTIKKLHSSESYRDNNTTHPIYPPSLAANPKRINREYYFQQITPLCQDDSECFFGLLNSDNYKQLKDIKIYNGGDCPENRFALTEIRKKYAKIKTNAIESANEQKRVFEYRKSKLIYLFWVFVAILGVYFFPKFDNFSVTAEKVISFTNFLGIPNNILEDVINLYPNLVIFFFILSGFLFLSVLLFVINLLRRNRRNSGLHDWWYFLREKIGNMNEIILFSLFFFISISSIIFLEIYKEEFIKNNFIEIAFFVLLVYSAIYLYELEYKRSRLIRNLYENKYILTVYEPFSEILLNHYFVDFNNSGSFSSAVKILDARISHEQTRYNRAKDILRLVAAIIAVITALLAKVFYS